jgi:hypothetical protein
MAQDMSHYIGGSRVAPQAQFSDPTPIARSAVGSISRPAQDSDVQGTGALLSGPKRHRPKAAGAIGSATMPDGPLNLDRIDDIVGASGLGRRPPAEKSPGEEMSDAKDPDQDVRSQADGSMVHRRRNPSGTVTQTPVLDGYPHLNYEPTPANLGDLRANLGTPDLFSTE